MKKTMLLLIISLTLLLNSCACEHSWLPATCNMPILCEKCGEISGTPATTNHQWTNTNCATKAVCEICNIEGEFGNHYWIAASYERAKYCCVCGTEEGYPLINQTDIRYVLASCAYRTIYYYVNFPSSLRIERVRYSYISADVPYITVILDCSAENAVGGRALIRCYSYNIENSTEIDWEVLPHLDYSSYTWRHDGQNQKIYCGIEEMFETSDDSSFVYWEELNPDLVIQRYNSFFE